MERLCKVCGCDISERGNNALYCVKCSAEKANENKRKWRQDNAEKVKENNRKWYQDNAEKAKEKRRKNIKELSIGYINNQLKKDGFTTEQINNYPELIEIKRLIIKTKRL